MFSLLHLAQQLAAQLGFRNEVDIGLHQVADRRLAGLGVGNLQQVLGVHDPLDVVDVALVHRYARVGILVQHLGELGDGHGDRDGNDFRPRRHHFAHRLVAELDHRLNQVAVALFQYALFLSGFDQRVHGFGRMLRLLLGMLFRERCHREREAQDHRDRHREVDEYPQHGNELRQPLALGAHEEYMRQQAIEDHDDEDEADRGLHQVERNPARVP